MDLHPLLVHFPIALLSTAGLLECIAVVTRRHDFSRAAWWNQLLGTIGLGSAAFTGMRAGEVAGLTGIALETLDRHQQMAFVLTALFAGLLLWRLGTRTLLPARGRWFYGLLYLAGIALLVAVAWYGGQLVFRFGAGVAPSAG